MSDLFGLLSAALTSLGFQENLVSTGGTYFAVCETCGTSLPVIPGKTDTSLARHSEWHEEGRREWNRNAVAAQTGLRSLLAEFEEEHGPISQEAVAEAMAKWPDSADSPRDCCDSTVLQHHQPDCGRVP